MLWLPFGIPLNGLMRDWPSRLSSVSSEAGSFAACAWWALCSPEPTPDWGYVSQLLCSIAGGALAFVSPSLAVHKTSSSVDRQREYLLDMIPPRSIPQSATWK